MTTGAGRLFYLFGFEMRTENIDEWGNVVEDWAEQFQAKARARFLTGGETVMAARLAGTQPVLLTVHADENTRRIRTDWRVVSKYEPIEELNIRSVTPTEDRKWIDLLCQTGVAT